MSLVEVLVVVFIIGLASAMVVLTLPERRSPQAQLIDHMRQTLVRAQDQAVLSGQPVGLFVSEKGYSAAIWQAEGWQAIPGAEVAFPISVDVETRINDETIRRNVRERGASEETAPYPDLVFDPTGLAQVADIRLRARGERIDIRLDETGEITVEAR